MIAGKKPKISHKGSKDDKEPRSIPVIQKMPSVIIRIFTILRKGLKEAGYSATVIKPFILS